MRMPGDTSLTGIHVPLITPFGTDGEVAPAALERLAHEVLDAGAAGIVALGTTGEPATLDAAEKSLVLDVCALVCRDRGVPLTVGAGTNDTRASAQALAELAGRGDISAVLVPVPYYTRPSEAGVLAHFTRLAAESPLPLIVYHIPYRTGLPLGAACLRAIGALPGVLAIKYAAGGIDHDTVELMGDLPSNLVMLAGDDVFVSPLLALGAGGGVVASAHLATARYVELASAWRHGETGRARALGHALGALSAALFAEPSPTVLKGVLHAQGRIPTPDVRLPLLPAGDASIRAAAARLADL